MPNVIRVGLLAIRHIFDDVCVLQTYYIVVQVQWKKLWMISHLTLWNPKLLRKHSGVTTHWQILLYNQPGESYDHPATMYESTVSTFHFRNPNGLFRAQGIFVNFKQARTTVICFTNGMLGDNSFMVQFHATLWFFSMEMWHLNVQLSFFLASLCQLLCWTAGRWFALNKKWETVEYNTAFNQKETPDTSRHLL